MNFRETAQYITIYTAILPPQLSHEINIQKISTDPGHFSSQPQDDQSQRKSSLEPFGSSLKKPISVREKKVTYQFAEEEPSIFVLAKAIIMLRLRASVLIDEMTVVSEVPTDILIVDL